MKAVTQAWALPVKLPELGAADTGGAWPVAEGWFTGAVEADFCNTLQHFSLYIAVFSAVTVLCVYLPLSLRR